MDLLQLEHFLAVVEERTFTRAAERVSRTQSAVSQSIKKLEEEVGAQLFTRDVRDVSLTDAGKLLAEYARRMVQGRDEAMRQIGALRDLKRGTLDIAAQESAAVYLLPGPLHAFLTRFPDIKVAMSRSSVAEIPRQVLDREVQIGFVQDMPGFRELEAVEVHCDDLLLIASPQHRLAARSTVSIKELDGEQFALPSLCTSTERVIMRLFAAHNTRCRVVAELWSFENIKSFVQANVGLAIVPRITVAQELRDGSLVCVPVGELDLRQRTLMIYRDEEYLSEPARELMKLVCAFKWAPTTQCA